MVNYGTNHSSYSVTVILSLICALLVDSQLRLIVEIIKFIDLYQQIFMSVLQKKCVLIDIGMQHNKTSISTGYNLNILHTWFLLPVTEKNNSS